MIAIAAFTLRGSLNELTKRLCEDDPTIKTCKANSAAAAPGAASGKTINIVAGLIPPEMNRDGTGREADIIRTALTLGSSGEPGVKAAKVRFFVEPFALHWHSYDIDKRFDAVSTVPGVVKIDGYKSMFYIMYRNGIGVLRDRESPVTSLEQLKGKRVVAFPGAWNVLPELNRLDRGYFTLFIEQPDQRLHSLMLFNGTVDAVIADAMIFAHFNAEVSKDGGVKARPVQFFAEGFQPTCYRMVFRKAEYRDLFDDGLRKMIERNQLLTIDRTYVDETIKDKDWDVQYIGPGGEPRCPDQ